ncbi:MAG: transporter substrate-binding protein [Paenibacillus sp.]|nr:transporter substrate-binding protein [Paenibacillus sp.]
MFKMNKSGKLLLPLFGATVLAVSGCSGGSKSPSPEPAATKAPEQSASPSSQNIDSGGLKLPIVEKERTISLWVPLASDFKGKSYNEKFSFQQMEKDTNIKVDFKHVSDVSFEEQFNLLMTSGKLPDVIFSYYWDQQASKYGTNGALMPLEDLIDKHAPNLKRLLSEYPDIKGQITSPEGHIYFLPNMVLDNSMLVQMFPQVRQDWLDKLGLKAPTTTDEWYEVLKAFKEKDPNGNGVQDELPFVNFTLEALMNLFGPAFGVEYPLGASTGFFVDNGKVKFGPYDPKYKELMAYLGKLQKEKLIDITTLKTFDELREKVTTDKAGSWFGWSGSYMGTFTNLMKDKKHPTFKISPVVPPKGPQGEQRHISNRWPAAGVGLAVAKSAKNPEEIVKWLDYQYSPAGVILNNFGVEGKSYELKGKSPHYSDSLLHPANGNTNTQELLLHTIGGGSWATVSDPDGGKQMRVANGQDTNPLEIYAPYVDLNKKLPPLQFLQKESDIVNPLMADIKTYVEEQTNAFIQGKPLADVDAFQAQLKKMNIEKVLEQYQIAYDRFKGKK